LIVIKSFDSDGRLGLSGPTAQYRRHGFERICCKHGIIHTARTLAEGEMLTTVQFAINRVLTGDRLASAASPIEREPSIFCLRITWGMSHSRGRRQLVQSRQRHRTFRRGHFGRA